MKILIAYYSRSGSTQKLAQAIEQGFISRGHKVDIEKIEPAKEHSFFYWWFVRIFKESCAIKPPKIKDVSGYDLICIGSPNWTRVALPVARYIKEVGGIEDKNIGFFSTAFLPPEIEWHVFSAAILDLTFSSLADGRRGRYIGSLLLSNIIKRRGLDSNHGKKKIREFCERFQGPIYSAKDYFLEKKEVERVRLFSLIYLASLVLGAIFFIEAYFFPPSIFSREQILYLYIIFLLDYIILALTLAQKGMSFVAKYVIGPVVVGVFTMLIVFFPSIYGVYDKLILLTYVLIFTILLIFRSFRALLSMWFFIVLSYVFLTLNYEYKEIFNPNIDLPILFVIMMFLVFFTHDLQKQEARLLDAQDAVEMARTTFEIRVNARTRELKQFSQDLETKVRTRTKELQVKVEELEKFQKLTIGRELKMIELKKEINNLKNNK